LCCVKRPSQVLWKSWYALCHQCTYHYTYLTLLKPKFRLFLLWDELGYAFRTRFSKKFSVRIKHRYFKWIDVKMNYSNLQNHAPAEVKVSGCCQPRALMVHLNGQLLDLPFQPRRSVDSWHLADGHERHSWLNKQISYILTLFGFGYDNTLFRFSNIKNGTYLLKRVSDSRLTCQVSLTNCILIVPRIWTVF